MYHRYSCIGLRFKAKLSLIHIVSCIVDKWREGFAYVYRKWNIKYSMKYKRDKHCENLKIIGTYFLIEILENTLSEIIKWTGKVFFVEKFLTIILKMKFLKN